MRLGRDSVHEQKCTERASTAAVKGTQEVRVDYHLASHRRKFLGILQSEHS